MSEIDIFIKAGIVLTLLFFSGFFSSSETALTAITAAKIRQLKDHDEQSADILMRMKKQLNQILTTILIGNNVVNIAATAILTQVTAEIFTGSRGTLIATGIMTVLILIFGEITPKTFAAQNPERIAVKVSMPLLIFSKILKPIIILLNKITSIIIKMFGGKTGENNPFVTEAEIRSMVNVGEEEGILKHQEKEMIEGVFDIDDTDVGDVMVPRIDIIATSEDTLLKNALDLFIAYGHSRIPVYKDTIDNITGIVYAKDILPFVSSSVDEINEKTVKSLTRKAYYVPETKKVNQLLKELQQKKIHMAIVLDEYGGTEGLVTIEDILEEIVGDILDEYDNEIDLIKKIEDGKYLVMAEVSLEEINEVFEVDLPEDDFDSLGGYIFSSLGRVPIHGDTVQYQNLVMTVVKLHNRRIKQIEIKIN